MGFDYFIQLFKKYNNLCDVVHILDADSGEYICQSKVKDLKENLKVIKSVRGLASRGFVPKQNEYVDGVFIYCTVRY